MRQQNELTKKGRGVEGTVVGKGRGQQDWDEMLAGY